MTEDHGIPSKKGGGGLVILALLMLLGAGGLVYWRVQAGEEEPVVEEIRKPAPKPAVELTDPAPPPPPIEDLEEEEEKAEPANEVVKTSPSGPSGCSGECRGSASAELTTALRARAGQARSCYNKALRVNPTIEGKMTVSMRLSPSGSVCSASVSNNTVGDPSVASCVTQKFRIGTYPAPTGGCMDTAIPLNFVKK